MSRQKTRARRGEVGLVRLRSGAWGIRWGRALAGQLGLAPIESTGMHDKGDAERRLRERQIEVFRLLGDGKRADAARRAMPAIALRGLVSDFLRTYAAGELPGPRPAPATVALYINLLLGERGSLLTFATSMQRTMSDRLDMVLVQRWLECERARAASDTIRLKLVAARRLAEYALGRGYVSDETLHAIRSLRAPAAAKGRARRDGVPSSAEVAALLGALSPAWWQLVAELQLRLGLRRAEVCAIGADWIDEAASRVHVRVAEGFDTKSHESRSIDGVDALTLSLAREVLALKASRRLSVSGYTEAWKRACRRLAERGTPWCYRSKTHGLRAAYATQSRLAGVPLSVVRDRMGHASETTTERHYIGRTAEPMASPFAAIARWPVTTRPAGDTVRRDD